MTVVSVVFDVGETLLDDSREFGAWADWLGVPGGYQPAPGPWMVRSAMRPATAALRPTA